MRTHTDEDTPQAPRDPQLEREREAAARRAAVRSARRRGPGANLEEAIRMVRAAEALHGAARGRA